MRLKNALKRKRMKDRRNKNEIGYKCSHTFSNPKIDRFYDWLFLFPTFVQIHIVFFPILFVLENSDLFL